MKSNGLASRRIACVVLLLAVGLFAACSPAAAPSSGGSKPGDTSSIKKGGHLKVSSGGQAEGLDPHTQQGGSHHFLFPLFDNLVAYDNDAKPSTALSLAEAWTVKNDTTIEFKIRKGVKFHDGTDLNAETIKWNIDRVLDPKTLAVGRGALTVLDRIEITDPYTIVFHLKEPSAPLLLNLGDKSGYINSRAGVEKWRDDYRRHPVGSGPFMFGEWIQDSHIKMKKNPDYWRKSDTGGALPYLDEITWLVLPDPAIRVAALRVGEIDMLNTGGLPNINIPQFKNNPDFTYIQTMSGSLPDIRINMDVFPMNNVNLRRAMSYALDREAIVKANFGELGQVVRGPVTPGYAWAYCEQCIQPTKRDLNKAKEELAKAGYVNGFEWEHVLLNSSAEARLLGEMIQAQLQDAGIRTKIAVRADFQRDFYIERRSPSFAGSFSDRADPDGSFYEKHHSKGSFFATRDPANINPKVDDLLDKARLPYDLAERKKIYNDAEKIVVDDVYGSIMMAYVGRAAALHKYVKGYELGGEGKGRFHAVWLDK